jgi:multisubunit Na+/H+ antiporter MnhF subunit
MNVWMLAAAALLFGLIPLGWVIMRRPPIDGLAALELASPIVVAILLLLCEVVSRPEFADLAMALAILSLGGGLVFVRFLERWV